MRRTRRHGTEGGRRRPRWHRALVAATAAALVGAGLTGGAAAAGPLPAAPDGSAASAAAIPAGMARVLAGQHVIYSYPGPTPPPELFDAIRAGQAAGVIFFSDNIVSLDQIRSVAQDLQAAAMASPVPVPLLLLTDQEGGQVRRLTLPGADGPVQSAAQVGASADPAGDGARTGHEAAGAMRAAGLNVNLAPVLGVHRTPGDFLDAFGRSYGSDPRTVAAAGGAFIGAQQADGVAAAAKHFPGLGGAAAGENTDEEPVTIDLDAATLRGVDEAPYRAAIAAGVDMVMPSWAVYPALDAGAPAGMSSTILRGDLRGGLGFDGVIVSDAIEAGALSAYGDAGERAVAALGAGQDLALCSARDTGEGALATTRTAAAITDGTLGLQEVLESTARVLSLRLSLR